MGIRPSKLLKFCSSSSHGSKEVESSESATPAEKVGWNEDLLTEIFTYVPKGSLLYLKLVSKKWRSLITSSHFLLLHKTKYIPLRTSALFLQADDQLIFVPLHDNNNNHRVIKTIIDRPIAPHPLVGLEILQSCNGLLLCRIRDGKHSTYYYSKFEYCIYNPTTNNSKFEYRIYNPTTNRLATIYRTPDNIDGQPILAFDPSKSPHYKVVFLVEALNGGTEFMVYSSETSSWRSVVSPLYISDEISWWNPVYFNGCIYWKSTWKNVDFLYFNVDEERLHTLPRPPPMPWLRERELRGSYMGESEGHLHFIEVYHYYSSIDVYELKSDYSGWFLKYKVNLTPLTKVFGNMIYPRFHPYDRYKNHVAVLSIVRRENFEQDSLLVLEIPGRVLLYNLVDSSFEEIREFPAPSYPSSFSANFQAFYFHYIESLSSR